MHEETRTNRFRFLTPQRELLFQSGIAQGNNRRASSPGTAHIFNDHMSNRGKAFDTREWVVAFIMEAFTSGDPASKPREMRGFHFLELDAKYLIYFGKTTDQELANEFIPDEPEILHRARLQRGQPSMFDVGLLPDDQPPLETPLRDLKPYLAAYTVDSGRWKRVVFHDIDYAMMTIVSQELDLSSIMTREDRERKRPPAPIFEVTDTTNVVRNSIARKDSTAS